MKNSTNPTIENRRARHDYEILETIQCGISLRGNEIKSLRAGMANFNGAWCSVDNGQLILHGMHITKYNSANSFDVDERRDRVLLAHRREINRLASKVMQNGLTLVPLRLEWSKQHCKVVVALCRGKHNYDKRETLKQRDVKRDMDRISKLH